MLKAYSQILRAWMLLLWLFALQGCTPIYFASKAVEAGASAATSVATKAVVLTSGAVVAVASTAVGIATTADKGENCVPRDTRIGDKVVLPDGTSAVVKTLSGTSTDCPNPRMPVRAELESAPASANPAAKRIP